MISQMNQRERTFVIGGGIILALVLIYFAALAPYQNALNRFEQQVTVRSGQLRETKILQGRYLEMQNQVTQMTRLMGKGQDFAALTFIENLVEQTAGRENLVSMRPQSPVTRNEYTLDSIEIKLERLSLKQLLELLAGVEKSTKPLQVKNLYLKQRFDDRSQLDATMTVTALRRTS